MCPEERELNEKTKMLISKLEENYQRMQPEIQTVRSLTMEA